MSKELAKNYDPSIVEDRIYQNWLDKGYFHAEVDKTKKPFTIVIPPPNITGHLHMGHALDNTMQDILIRWKRMQGYNALWVPGTDHAAISTEVKIVNKMREEGLTKEDIGREGFLKRAWAWKEEYGSTILNQLKKLGSSCDWERERFTMDAGLSDAVLTVFCKLYEKGYIYQGEKLINWCPTCQTTISDAEVEHEDKQGGFWHIKYPIKGTDRFLEFATTRPETMLGDTAIAVHPDDERYKDIVGKVCVVPFVNREIPIIADEYVDMEFGTGVVKITPAHDPNDFEVGERHNLPKINILNDDGTINANGGKFEGMDRYDARKQIVEELDEMGLFIRKEEINHAVGVHDRCHTVIEPLIKKQWFVKMEELAKPALDAYYKKDLKFVPDRFGKIYTHWLEDIHDWCISRQLWWGHRIPAYYCECGEVIVSKEAPKTCPKCGSTNIKQDEDCLDTWFSSALWPFTTLGWPDVECEDFKAYFPTDTLVTGYDIIFFWVSRMIFQSFEFTDERPFKNVLIHGLVRDAEGRKMSKSLGNGVDPMDVIEKYGADSLRYFLTTNSAPGQDLRYIEEKVESTWNFINKIWNASRFVIMNLDGMTCEDVKLEEATLNVADQWILGRLNETIEAINYNADKFEFGEVGRHLYNFIWEDFCNWYIEMAKLPLQGEDEEAKRSTRMVLTYVLESIVKLLHPFMPFVTEEIYQMITRGNTACAVAAWPVVKPEYNNEKAINNFTLLMDIIRSVRNIRAEVDAPMSKQIRIFINAKSEEVLENLSTNQAYLKRFCNPSELVIEKDLTVEEETMTAVVTGADIFLPTEGLIDVSAEIERLNNELKKLAAEVKRGESKLANEKFVAKAPTHLVEEERNKLADYKEKYATVEARLTQLQK